MSFYVLLNVWYIVSGINLQTPVALGVLLLSSGATSGKTLLRPSHEWRSFIIIFVRGEVNAERKVTIVTLKSVTTFKIRQ